MNRLHTMISTRASRWLALPITMALMSVTTAAQDVQEVTKRWGLNPPASSYGHRFDDLFAITTALVSVSFLIVLIMLLVPVFRDRAKPGKKAHFDAGSSLHDKRFTAIVSLIVFIVLDASVLVIAMEDLRDGFWAIPQSEDSEAEPYLVEVLAQQWAWNFRATGPDGEFDTADDILSLNRLTVPKDRPVVLNMTSKDVIHSLFLPDMRFKRDVNPGAINAGWFEPIVAGDFAILCAELCGFAHYQMHGMIHVLEQDDFNLWEQDAAALALAVFDEDDTEAHWAWAWQE
ncbi:MAG: cytochrome c oxidase subunit 2 [Pseudohongiellaceae bacterium]